MECFSLVSIYEDILIVKSNRPLLVIVAGPTAVGKTAVAINLAKSLHTEIISADSRQFYREMSIGTAKPSQEELAAVPHHFIDSLSIHQHWTVADFEREAMEKLRQLFASHSVVIVSGGSGLYIKALLEGLDAMPEVPKSLRDQLNKERKEGLWPVWVDELQRIDPLYAAEVDIHNPMRLQRAMEIIRSTGKAFSSFRNRTASPRFFDSILLVLDRPREELYARINQRVDEMVKMGLFQEAEALFPYRQLNALQTVGYSEIFAYMEGDCNREEAIDLIKRNTRRYAKRQLTWFRKQADAVWLHAEDTERIASLVQEAMQ